MSKKILIFDGHNVFIRSFVVNPHADENGNPIGGLLGTLRSVKFMIRETQADRVFFVWDGVGGSQRRRGVVEGYKMGRKPRLNRPVDEGVGDSGVNMHWQMEKTRALLGYLGVTQLCIDNIEADDTIGYLVGALEPTQKVVVSSDRDMWQLVSDTTTIYWPTKKVFITKETFKDHSSILPENYVLFRALSGHGDASDNVRGIKGLGEKTIVKLFPEFEERHFSLDDLADECRATIEQQGPDPKGKFRWHRAILDSLDLVRRNVQVMQLVDPVISVQAAGIIRQAIAQEPSFNISNFKVALLNNAIQITDQDFFTTFQEYRMRAEHKTSG
jgi:DNA polymerase-1